MNSLVLFLTTLFLFAFAMFQSFILKPLHKNKLYKYYDLRDRICLKAMSGDIDENSAEYQFFMFLINNAISINKEYDSFFSITSHFSEISGKNKKQFLKIKELSEKLFINKTLSPFVEEYYRLCAKQYIKNLRTLKRIVYFIYPFMYLLDFIKNRSVKSSKAFKSDQIDSYNEIQKHYEERIAYC